MNVKCDLCGGMLQIRRGGLAVCTGCGLCYSMERLREMLTEIPTVEELIASFTAVPLNPPEEFPEDPLDEFLEELPEDSLEECSEEIPESPPEAPEVPLKVLLSTTKSPYEVQLHARDKPKKDLAMNAIHADSFLMIVDDVYSVGTIGADVIGTVECGSIKPGDKVQINDGAICDVAAIEHHGMLQEFAWKGMYASILLKGVDKSDVSRGDILTAADAAEAADTPSSAPSPLCGGRVLDYSDLVPLHSEQFVMRVTKASRRPGFRTWYLSLEGRIERGCVANLDSVFLNGSAAYTWTVLSVEPADSSARSRACAGMTVSLEITGSHKTDPNAIKTLVGVAAPEESLDHFSGTPRQFFSALLVRQFYPKYRIFTDVNYDGIPIPITYLFYQKDKPKLALFLLDSFDSHQRYQVEKAIEVCKEAGIPALQFFMDYRNTAHYVAMRIRKTLG